MIVVLLKNGFESSLQIGERIEKFGNIFADKYLNLLHYE